MFEYEIYDLKSNSWTVLDITPGLYIEFYQCSVSLNGNTYFFVKEDIAFEEEGPLEIPEPEDFLVCFDFTTENFGQLAVESGSFFIDEEKKVVVVFDLDEIERYKMAYIIGENGYLKKVNLGKAFVDLDESPYGRPLVSSYYVPSLVQTTNV
ncbi:putative F-box protein [Cardamine amara subsp. amara]|uniref:F-box protein n=1 Tax=Cardamine amara subsp. amara TaxID=228776 RepID=A0ABD1BGM2_CARAN